MQIRSIFKLPVRIPLALTFMLFIQSYRAQYFEFKWSEERTYSNNRDGFFSGFITTNSSFIYTLNSNYAVSHLNRNNKLMLTAYDKTSMEEIATVALKGFPENKPAEATYEPLQYFKTVVLEDRVLVFWTKLINTDSTKTEELYVESFKIDLKREQQVRLVYTAVQQVDVQQSQFALPSVVVASNPVLEDVVIGSEVHAAGKPVVFRYLLLSGQLKTGGEQQIVLPGICGAVQNGLISVYDYAQDGNLYIRSGIPQSEEERHLFKQREADLIPALTVLQPLTGKSVTVRMEGEQKTITDFSYSVTGNKTRIVGFFGDLTKDPSGIDKQGMFYADIDSDTLAEVALSYTPFEKTSLNKLFPRTRGGRRKNVVQPLTDEQINTRFDIEAIFPQEDGSFVLFLTRKYNYTEITSHSGLDGRNVYDSVNYCEKNNVSAIRLSDKGQIVWTGNIERNTTYEGTDVADLRIISKGNKFYVIYGTEPATPSKRKKRTKPSDLQDNIDYVTFDQGTGKAKKVNLPVNEDDVPQKEKKMVNPNCFYVYDNQFYFSKMIVRQKTAWYVANVLFFPSIYYSALSGNVKSAKGGLGTLRLIDGKPPRKKNR